jgi:predicted RNA binding protein YcfA (HicA-like mRNA interferase family)
MGFTITAAELIAFLTAQGFHIETRRGRHGVKAVKGGQRIPIPTHSGDMRKGTVNNILNQAGFDENDVIRWRNGK